MDDFGKWLREFGQTHKTSTEEDRRGWCPAVGETLHWSLAEQDWVYPCRVCDEDAPILIEPEDFDPDDHYCGRSPHCCP